MNIVASVFRPEKEAKVIQIKKEEVVVTDGIIFYLDSPMESTETIVGLMNY